MFNAVDCPPQHYIKKKLFAYKTKMLTTWIISYKTEQQTHIVSTVTH